MERKQKEEEEKRRNAEEQRKQAANDDANNKNKALFDAAMQKYPSEPLISAASNNDVDSVSALLLDSDRCDPCQVDSYRYTALIYAARYTNDSRLIELLLSNKKVKATIDKGDNYGNTALYWAANYNKQKCVEVFLKGGANPNVKSKTTVALI